MQLPPSKLQQLTHTKRIQGFVEKVDAMKRRYCVMNGKRVPCPARQGEAPPPKGPEKASGGAKPRYHPVPKGHDTHDKIRVPKIHKQKEEDKHAGPNTPAQGEDGQMKVEQAPLSFINCDCDFDADTQLILQSYDKIADLLGELLRDGSVTPEEQEAIVDKLDYVADHCKIPEDVVVFRNINDPEELTKGDTFQDAAFGYMSTNKEDVVAKGLFAVTVPKNFSGFYLDEGNKLLLPRDCEYTVTSVERDGNQWIVKATIKK